MQVLNGIAFEARENPTKTLDEIRAIVSKNLAKDQLYYVKNAMFGIKGVGISDEVPGMKASKTDQMEKVKMVNEVETRLAKNSFKKIPSKQGTPVVGDEWVCYPETDGKTYTMEPYDFHLWYHNESNVFVGTKAECEEFMQDKQETINEAKGTKLDQRLKDIHKAGDIVTLEAKMEAIDEEINAKNERINMIGENEDLAELVNPVKLREMKKRNQKS